MANQKFGTAMPSWVAPMMTRSAGWLRRVAAMMPTGKAMTDRQRQRHQRQRQAHPQALGDQLGDRHAVGVADAEIAVDEAARPRSGSAASSG